MLVDNKETQKCFPALGTKLFFHANSAKKKMVSLRQLTALSRARKQIIMTNQIKLLTLNNQFC